MEKILYLIDRENFNGTIINTITEFNGDKFADYTADKNNNIGNLTFEEYMLKKNYDPERFILLEWEELSINFLDPYYKSLQKPFKEISEDFYWEMLECLPPLRWHNLKNGLSVFFISEAYTATLHGCYIHDKVNEKYFSALRCKYTDDNILIEDFNNRIIR